MKYCFFLDIDGTIVDSSKRPSKTLLRVLQEAQAKGHKFFINTARTRTNVSPEVFPLDKLDGLCAGCGMSVIYRGNTVFEEWLPPEQAFRTVDIIQGCQPDARFVLETADGLLYSKEILQLGRSDRFSFGNSRELRDSYPWIRLQKLATYSGDRFSRETADALSEYYQAYFHQRYTELVPYGYDKGKAVSIVERLLGIPHDATVAIGDSHNDVPMMDYCAYSVAMEGSPDDVKAVCNETAERVEDDGAAKAIARLCGVDYGRRFEELNK